MTKTALPKTPVGTVYLVAIVALGVTASALAAALYSKASAAPMVTIARPGDRPRVVRPGLVPDVLAKDFALDFITLWETYSPETLKATLTHVKSRVAPSAHHAFEPVFEKRRNDVKEVGMVSQVIFDDPGELEVIRLSDRIEVILRGTQRIYVADRLAVKGRRIYRVALEAGYPTRQNPTGLQVTGLGVKILNPSEEANHDTASQ